VTALDRVCARIATLSARCRAARPSLARRRARHRLMGAATRRRIEAARRLRGAREKRPTMTALEYVAHLKEVGRQHGHGR
jgi:hypothetical protein